MENPAKLGEALPEGHVDDSIVTVHKQQLAGGGVLDEIGNVSVVNPLDYL